MRRIAQQHDPATPIAVASKIALRGEANNIAVREIRIVRKNGDVRWCAAASQPVADTDGGYRGFRASARDPWWLVRRFVGFSASCRISVGERGELSAAYTERW